MVALLIQERDRLNRAVEALSGSTGKRRGRPPKNPLTLADGGGSHVGNGDALKKRRGWTAAMKKAAADRMKARWKAKKKAAK
jgi:hypothetical protein